MTRSGRQTSAPIPKQTEQPAATGGICGGAPICIEPTWDDGLDEALRPYRLAAEAFFRREDVIRLLGGAVQDERLVDELQALLCRWYLRSACEPRAVICDNLSSASGFPSNQLRLWQDTADSSPETGDGR